LLGLGTYRFYLKNAIQISPKNVIKAYYDALDFKEFKKAYSYLNPKSGKKLDQYMLEVSVNDGVLSSYAKLDELKVTMLSQTDSTAKAKVETYWITPLERIDKTYYHELVKLNSDWFLKPLSYDLDIPPDQLFIENSTQFYTHGRRRITSEQTHHEDVLKQPVLEVLTAKLIQFKNQYAIIGELQNVDNVPADVVVKGTLYTNQNQSLASYNVKHQMKHKLMPKETTSFRMNFEGISWNKNTDTAPKTFNPNAFTSAEINEKPTKFNLQCAGNVAYTDLYKSVVLNNLQIQDTTLRGVLFNAGVQEVTIPQLLISYYNAQKQLIWVDHQYLREGIRQQRKQFFTYETKDISTLDVINTSLKYVFVNGLENSKIKEKLVANRREKDETKGLIKINGKGFQYIKIEINNYIGAPN